MSWFNVWDGLKNKTCRYLLQRYLGQFLENPLNLEQLNIELYNGKATVKDVALKVDALNELFEEQGWSLEVVRGHVGQLTVTIPWNSLISSDSTIEIKDFEMTLRPIKRVTENISMIESMWSSVSSSMQLAEECMKQAEEINNTGMYDMQSNTFVGLEKFAETIDNVLNRIKANFTNTRIKLEYPNNDGAIILGVIIDIEDFNYKNETGADKHFEQYKSYDNEFNINNIEYSNTEQMILVPTFAKHNITLSGVTIYTEETPIPGFGSYNIENVSIPILSVYEKQNIIVKVKQTEEIIGPKISLDMDLGAISVLVTPRQIHLLLKILNSFSEEECDDQTGQSGNDFVQNKENYLRDTASNCNYMKENMTGLLRTTIGDNWRRNYGDTEVPLTPLAADNLNKNYRPNMDYYAESMSSSMTSSSTVTKTIRLSRRMTNMETSAEILNFIAKILSLSIVILHEDIIVEAEPLSNYEEQMELLKISQSYFENVRCKREGRTDHPEKSNENFFVKHHLLFNLSPILVNGSEHRNRNTLLYKVGLTAVEVDAFEVLQGESYPLIQFDREKNCEEGFHKTPELTLFSESTLSNLSPELGSTIVNITLDPLHVDLDITIYERLGQLLAPCPFTIKETDTDAATDSNPACLNGNGKASYKIIVKCNELWLKLRIPIADTRPSEDPNRLPWWQKSLRTDFFYFSFHQFSFLTQVNCFTFSADVIDMFYCEKSSMSKVHVLLVKKDEQRSKLEPKIIIQLLEGCSSYNTDSEHQDCQPFSSDRVCRQSDTAHVKRDVAEYETLLLPGESHEIEKFSSNTMKDSEVQIQIYLPAVYVLLESKQLYEIVYNRFIGDFLMWEPRSIVKAQKPYRNTASTSDPLLMSSLMDSIYVSTSIEDPSNYNQDYEKLFHQTISPLTESIITARPPILASSHMRGHQMEHGINESIYLSTTETQMHFKNPEPIKRKVKRHICSLQLRVEEGFLTIFVPVRDNSNHVLPGQLGKFNFRIQDLVLFTVSGFKSDANIGYVCLQLQNLEAFHCSTLPMDYPLGNPFGNSKIEEFMTSTFYKTPKTLTKGDLQGNSKRDLVTLVIEIKKKPAQKVKRLKITTGIQRICLRNIPDMSPSSWLSQLMDFFDVIDYPVEGYTPYGVITEMQLHFWDCAIDYRPLNFPYRAVVEIGSFTLSSNIISAIIGCTMRFVLEECIFSIAPHDLSRNDKYPLHKITFLKANDLVPVLDVGLLDISLRISDGKSERQPLTDVRCSIHDVHLRTCADSGKALAQLIVHIANDSIGLDTESQNMDSSVYSDSNSILSSDKCEEVQEEISLEQQQRVRFMMADAVKDTKHISKSYGEQEEQAKFEVYYFPDETSSAGDSPNKTSDPPNPNELNDIINFESNVMLNSYFFREADEAEEPLPQVKTELGSIKAELKKTEELDFGDDDFCVIREDEKQFLDSCGIKNVKISEDPLRIVDNHFTIPSAKTDLLKAPDSFPMPERRYTLCEMSFTWHLYGGKDFPDVNSPTVNVDKVQKSKARMSEAYKSGVAFSKSSGDIQFGKKPKEKLTWKNAGGPNRDHSILVEIQFSKIRLSHEIYPVRCSHSSRQVLIVGDVEIRDRLQSSEINKFLYHPSAHNSLSKSSENLLIVKALHVRPNPRKSLSEECSLRISLLPLRLHIDQETLIFLIDYFSNLGEKSGEETEEGSSKKSETDHKALEPVMGLDDVPEAVQNLKARRIVNENLDLLMEQDASSTTTEIMYNTAQTTDSMPIYFREIVFSPEVPICLDYHGRKVEFSGGLVSGLVMGLFQLQCSEIRLTKLTYRRGLLGLDKLFNYMYQEWLKDIKRNQLPKILKGVGPTNALFQFFEGIYDLFWLPIEQYQRDGRLIRGLQMGAQSFSARTALAALEITSRIIQLLQYTAETAFDMVSPGPSVRRLKRRQHGRKKRPHRPKDIREGVTNAFLIVKEGINDSANTLIETAVAEHEQKGYTGAVGAVVRQIPQLVVCPAVLATQATTNILGGVKSSLVPEAKFEAREKWKDDCE